VSRERWIGILQRDPEGPEDSRIPIDPPVSATVMGRSGDSGGQEWLAEIIFVNGSADNIWFRSTDGDVSPAERVFLVGLT